MSKRLKPGYVIRCQECGMPWGAYGSGQADALLDEFRNEWAERWRDDLRWEKRPMPVDPPDPGELPPISEALAYHITDRDVAWMVDNGICEPEVADPPCWMEYWRGAVPEWWVRTRLRPWTRWDCCNLPTSPVDLYDERAAEVVR